MKKMILILILWLAVSLNGIHAQYDQVAPPEPSEFELLYIFDTSLFANCFSTDNNLRTTWSVYPFERYAKFFAEFDYYNSINREWCNPDLPALKGYVIGANCIDGSSNHYAKAFAQEYNFAPDDIPYDDYVVCGVAIKLGGYGLDEAREFYILNQNFDTLATTTFHTDDVPVPVGWEDWETVPWNRNDWNTYYFSHECYETLTNINNFRIAFPVPKFGSGNRFSVHHTCNVYSPCIRDAIYALGGPMKAGLCYDTIMMGFIDRFTYPYYDSLVANTPRPSSQYYNFYLDYLDYLSQFGEEDNIPLCISSVPKFLQRNGEWINFADDPVYEIWQNIHIAMVPIIMIPRASQSLSEVELEKMCYVFPNPAKDIFKVMSHYTIKDIQVFDMMGKKVLEKEVNYFETEIIVDNFLSGTYIVKINTAKGTTEKKLVVQ